VKKYRLRFDIDNVKVCDLRSNQLKDLDETLKELRRKLG